MNPSGAAEARREAAAGVGDAAEANQPERTACIECDLGVQLVEQRGDPNLDALQPGLHLNPLRGGAEREPARVPEPSKALGYDVSAGPTDRLPWDYTVDVFVDRLHGTMAGTAVLDAGYRITPRSGAGEVVEYRFSRTVPLPREGYPGLVEAEADLARQLAESIAAALREMGARPGP